MQPPPTTSEDVLAERIRQTVSQLSDLVYDAVRRGITVSITESGKYCIYNGIVVSPSIMTDDKLRKLEVKLKKTVEF